MRRSIVAAWLAVVAAAVLLPSAPAAAQGFVLETTERFDVDIKIEPSGDLLTFSQWVVSREGQAVVEKVGYYPLNEKDRLASAAKLGTGAKTTAQR